jgi:hypothetical protein
MTGCDPAHCAEIMQLEFTPATGPKETPIGFQPLKLEISVNLIETCVSLEWRCKASEEVVGRVRVSRNQNVIAFEEAKWTIEMLGSKVDSYSSNHHSSIRAKLNRFRQLWPVAEADISARLIQRPSPGEPAAQTGLIWPPQIGPWQSLAREIAGMLEEEDQRLQARARQTPRPDDPGTVTALRQIEQTPENPLQRALRRIEHLERRDQNEQKRAEQRRQEIELERKRRKLARAKREEERALRSPAPAPAGSERTQGKTRPPLPPIQVTVLAPSLSLQDTFLPLADLRTYFLREKAAQWWVSNQSDTLLCLPFCRIERLEYQLRTTLRVLGPLRGRALLSDEVGLGKTIEAGLVLKELLTRGMASRFLVLTVPSLVDQWQEELAEKFGLSAATTNGGEFRADAEKFWRESRGIVASLHTLKQPGHLAVAQTIDWDLLIVDEAHYLRNRASQA